uniref:Uncharacterized protein n=1 Tax=Oryza nivara TaxID=4536 RepID=A0A0E0IUY2_ORYNI
MAERRAMAGSVGRRTGDGVAERRTMAGSVGRRTGDVPLKDDDALAPGEGDRGAANIGGLYELYATLPPYGGGGGGSRGPFSSYAVAGRAVLVDAVLRVVGELVELLHPLQDEVVHGAIVGLGLHAVEGVHGGQVVAQLGDLAADTAELLVFLGQQLTNIAYEVLSRVLHASISLAWLAGS